MKQSTTPTQPATRNPRSFSRCTRSAAMVMLFILFLQGGAWGQCSFNNNDNTGIVYTPCINMPTYQQTAANNIDFHDYFIMNVIQGLTYVVKTCQSPGYYTIQLTVYNESTQALVAFSNSNTGNNCGNSRDAYLSFTSTFSGQVRILLNRRGNCDDTGNRDYDVLIDVTGGSNTLDNQTNAGTNTWIGHIYDGTNSGVAYNVTFSNYLGYYTQTETFNETFGGFGADANCYSPVNSNGTQRASVLDVTYSVRYRMNSTKKGLYVANIGSDDGSRLTVDGNLIYDDWTDQGYAVNSGVLMNLTGSSSLLLDFYENAGGNQISFQNLTLVLANNLTTNTTQSICLGASGSAISGDIYSTLPTGISLSGTGYQWAYGSSSTGPWTDISGATGATYTPSSAAAPFNIAGTYYIIRKAILSSANNVSPKPYVATNESNAATMVVNALPAALSLTGSIICSYLGNVGTITSSTSANEVSYQLYDGSNNPVQSAQAGTGSGLTWSGLTAGNGYYVTGTDANSCTSTSNTVNVTINAVSPGTIAGDQTICSGVDPAAFTSNSPGGGSGTITYRWEIKTGAGSWTTLPGATGLTYDPPPVPVGYSGTTMYRRVTISTENGVSCEAVSNELTLTILATGTWLGFNTDWFDPDNWCGGVPTESTDALINSGPSKMPQIQGIGAECKNLYIGSGASLTIKNDFTLNIYGDYTNNGSLASNNSTIIFNSDFFYYISGNLSGTNKFYDITFNGQGNWDINSDIEVGHDFTIIWGGDVYFNYHDLTLSGGNLTNNGSITEGNVTFNGTSVQSIGGDGVITTSFNNLTLNNPAGLTLDQNVNVGGTLTFSAGLITTNNTKRLTISGSASIAGANASRYVSGKLARVFDDAGSKEFPIGKGGNYRPLTITYTALNGESWVTAEQFESVIPGTKPPYIFSVAGRFWEITEYGLYGNTYDLTLDGTDFTPGSYPDVYILKGDGTTNAAISGSYSSPYYTITGQTSFSNFAPAAGCDPPTITVQPASPAAVCAGTGTPSFSVTATAPGSPALTYLWQVNSGSGWGNVPTGAPYSGETTSTLTVTNPPYSMNGYAYRVIVSRSCGSSTTSNGNASLTVIPDNTAGTPSSTPSLCINTAISPNITHTTSGATGIGTPTGLPAGVIASWATNTITISGTPTASGTFNYSITLTGGCGSVNATGTITVHPLPAGTLSNNGPVCDGDNALLTFDATTGTGPFDLVINSITYTDIPDLGTISVTPAMPSTNYTLTSITDKGVTPNCASTVSVSTTVLVYSDQPVAGFTALPNPAACNADITFDGSSSSHPCPGRQIIKYEWDFDCPVSSPFVPDFTSANPTTTHAYPSFGTFRVVLRVTDDDTPEKTSTASVNIAVDQGNQPPVAVHGGPYTAECCGEVTLNGSGSSDPNEGCGDEIKKYEWNIDCDGTWEWLGVTKTLDASILQLYSTGSHCIQLRVTDAFGATHAASTTLTITPPLAPSATKLPDVSTVCEGDLLSLSAVTNNGCTLGLCQIEYSHNGGVWTTTLTPFAAIPGTNTIAIRKNCYNGNCPTSEVVIHTWTAYPTGRWLGLSADWHTPSNWCGGVPTVTTDVSIVPPVPFMPEIGTGDAECHDLSISTGASLAVSGTHELSVYGNWSDLGTISPGTGVVTFTGPENQQLTDGGSAVESFFDLTISKPSGSVNSSGITTDIANNFMLSSGELAGGNISIAGDWIHNGGTYTPGSGRVTFDGTESQVIGGSLSTLFHKMTLNNTTGLSLQNSVNIDLDLKLEDGKLILNTSNLRVNSTGTFSLYGPDDYVVTNSTGTLQLWVSNNETDIHFPVGTPGSYNPAVLAFSGSASPDFIKVRVGEATSLSTHYSPIFDPTGLPIETHIVNKMWILDEGLAGGSIGTMKLYWSDDDMKPGFDYTNCGIGHYKSGTTDEWVFIPPSQAMVPVTGTYGQTITFDVELSPFGIFSPNILCYPPSSPYCAGTAQTVGYYAYGSVWNSGNDFKAELSDPTGSFGGNYIGTLNSTAIEGNISATIPGTTPGGTAYRMRLVSTAPVVTGQDNGSNLTIYGLPLFTASFTNITCFNAGNGTITLNASGGLSPYQYNIYNGTTWQGWQSSNVFNNLSPNTYTVKIKDDHGCEQINGTVSP